MGQVSNETIAKVNNYLRSLPKDQVSKCALCNETLTHIVKLGEVETGAGPMTVSRALAELINLTATVNDKVTPKALDNRVRRTERVEPKSPKRGDTTTPLNSGPSESIASDPSAVSLSTENATSKIITGRKLIMEGLEMLKKMANSKMLRDGGVFIEVENQLRLVCSFAKEIGIKI